jgi:hypothetical protein
MDHGCRRIRENPPAVLLLFFFLPRRRLVADGWCWFVMREKYCWLVGDDWFILREKYYWLVSDKPN